jgi:hypothetical protein
MLERDTSALMCCFVTNSRADRAIWRAGTRASCAGSASYALYAHGRNDPVHRRAPAISAARRDVEDLGDFPGRQT